MTADTTTELERLIAAEHLLAEHLPNVLMRDRMDLAITLRQIFNGESTC